MIQVYLRRFIKRKFFFQNNQNLRFFVQMSIFSYMNIVMIMKRPVLQGLIEMAVAPFW